MTYFLGASQVSICSLSAHTIPYIYTLPLFANRCRLSKSKYGPCPTFDPYMTTLHGIVNSERPSYRLKMLYPTTYQIQPFGTPTHAIDQPLH